MLVQPSSFSQFSYWPNFQISVTSIYIYFSLVALFLLISTFAGSFFYCLLFPPKKIKWDIWPWVVAVRRSLYLSLHSTDADRLHRLKWEPISCVKCEWKRRAVQILGRDGLCDSLSLRKSTSAVEKLQPVFGLRISSNVWIHGNTSWTHLHMKLYKCVQEHHMHDPVKTVLGP